MMQMEERFRRSGLPLTCFALPGTTQEALRRIFFISPQEDVMSEVLKQALCMLVACGLIRIEHLTREWVHTVNSDSCDTEATVDGLLLLRSSAEATPKLLWENTRWYTPAAWSCLPLELREVLLAMVKNRLMETTDVDERLLSKLKMCDVGSTVHALEHWISRGFKIKASNVSAFLMQLVKMKKKKKKKGKHGVLPCDGVPPCIRSGGGLNANLHPVQFSEWQTLDGEVCSALVSLLAKGKVAHVDDVTRQNFEILRYSARAWALERLRRFDNDEFSTLDRCLAGGECASSLAPLMQQLPHTTATTLCGSGAF